MKTYLKTVGITFALTFTTVCAFGGDVSSDSAASSEYPKELAFWEDKISEIDIEWRFADGTFSVYSKDLTNELVKAEKLLADFEKAFPKESRSAKEKCVEAGLIYRLEGPEKVIDGLILDLSTAKTAEERQAFYNAISHFRYFYKCKDEIKKKVVKALNQETCLSDPIKTKCLEATLGFSNRDLDTMLLWEQALRAKDPCTAVEIWRILEENHYLCLIMLRPHFIEKVKDNIPKMTKEEAEASRKCLALKDNYLKYLREEAPFSEEEFYKRLAEAELNADKKSTHDHMIIMNIMEFFGEKAKPIDFIERKSAEWRALEEQFEHDDEDGTVYPWKCKGFWKTYRNEAFAFGCLDKFKEDLLVSIEKHPGFFEPVEIYCETLAREGKAEEAKAFLRKHFPEESLVLRPNILPSYVMLFRLQGWDINEKELVKKIFDLWLQKDPNGLAEDNQYLWERLWTRDFRDIRKKVREELADPSKASPAVLKRLKEITAEEDYVKILEKMQPNIKSYDQIVSNEDSEKGADIIGQIKAHRAYYSKESKEETIKRFTTPEMRNGVETRKIKLRNIELKREKDPILDKSLGSSEDEYDVFDPLDPLNVCFDPDKAGWDLKKEYLEKKYKELEEKN